MAKKYVSTSRADRTDDKRKRDANKAESKRNSRKKKDIAAVATGVAAGGAIVAGKSIRAKSPSSGNLYRANQAANLKAMSPIMKGMSKEDILRSNRRAAIDLARAEMKQSKTAIKGAKGSGWGSGLRKDDVSVKISKAKKGQGMGSSRYARLTGGGGAPGRGMGQGGGGGGGFLKRSK
jgi:hypothetical protein